MDEKELAAELQASKQDPDEWGDAEFSVTEPKRRLSAMVSVRLTSEELEHLQRRAEERGQSVSAYVRDMALSDVSERPQTERGVSFAISISTGGTYSAHVNTPAVLTDGRRLATTSG